jgi:hypothetical protein
MGWIVGGQLLEDSFFIRTGQENTSCPNGIGERGTTWMDSSETAAGGQLLHQDRTGEHLLSKWNRESGTWAG